MATGAENILSLINNLPDIEFAGGNETAKLVVNWTGSSWVFVYYTSYVSASNNYGHQLVFNASGIRYDAITNGDLTTIWTK